MAMQDPIIKLSRLVLTLNSGAGAVEILRDVDLTVLRGEAVAILGPSGSGKSSLMAVASGLERATGGQVHVAGYDFTMLDEDGLALARRGRIGLVLQAFHLIPTMTALENVATPLELAGVEDATARATAQLHAVGLGHRLGHYPAQLSGGEQQRVALARAVVSRPSLLFADEPTGNLDGATGHAIIDLMFGLHREHGMTLMLITHDPELAERCQRIIEMRDGRIVADRPVHSVRAAE